MDGSDAKARLLGVFGLRPGEGRRTLAAALYLFVVIANYIALKAARDSLFINRFGARKLPYAIVGVALGVAIFVAIYLRVARRVRTVPLTAATLLFFASNLGLFWWLASQHVPWLYPVLYIWAGIYGIVAPAQAWTLMNDVFTTREAKRAFGLIGGGGILGGISGGWIASFATPRIGTVNFLLVLAALLAIAAGLVMLLARYRRPVASESGEYPVPRHLPDSLRLVIRSSHLRGVAAVVFLGALATAVAEFQFQTMASGRLHGDALTAFFGAFYGTVGVMSLALQVLLASRLFRWFGLAGTILLMPLSMFAATVALAAQASLGAAVAVKGSDSVLKHSLDRSSREIAFLPVSRSIKVHVKSAIDMVVDRLGDGIAGLLLILCTSVLALSVRQLAWVNLVVLGGWIWAGVRTGRSYVTELGRSIATGGIEAGSWDEALAGPETLGALHEALVSGDETRVVAALAIVADNPSWNLRDDVLALARCGSAEVRARALAILLDPANEELDPRIGATFDIEDQALFAECVDLITAETPEIRNRLAIGLLSRAGGGARGAWFALMLRRLGPDFEPFARRLIELMIAPAVPAQVREAAATAIGLLPASFRLGDLLFPLLEDSDPHVVAAAARSAGALGSPDLLAALVPLLGQPSLRRTVRQAIAARRDEALGPVRHAGRRLAEATSPSLVAARRHLPEVLERIGTPRALAALVALLRDSDREVVRVAGEALVRVRLSNADWRVLDGRVALAMARREAAEWQRHSVLRRALDTIPAEAVPTLPVLAASLDDILARHRDAIFRALSLAYPPRQIALAQQGLASPDPERRANAVELLDNLRPRRARADLLAVLDGEAPRGVPFLTRQRVPAVDGAAALRALTGDADGWVRAAALHALAELDPAGAADAIVFAQADRDPRVQEAVALLCARREETMAPEDAISVIEKVLALRRVELFQDIPAEQLSGLAAIARTVAVPAGDNLCRQGDPAGDLLVILAGNARLDRDGRPVGRLAAGDALGAWGLFEDEPRPFTATAETAMRCLAIDRAGFEDVWSENPDLARALVSRLVKRVRQLTT